MLAYEKYVCFHQNFHFDREWNETRVTWSDGCDASCMGGRGAGLNVEGGNFWRKKSLIILSLSEVRQGHILGSVSGVYEAPPRNNLAVSQRHKRKHVDDLL